MNFFSLEGKTVLVTGASSGIGQRCAIACSEVGARIILLGRNKEALEQTLAFTANKELHFVHAVDNTDFVGIEGVVDEVFSRCGRIDGIINCAGISTTLPIKFVTPEEMNNFFDVNVISTFNLTRLLCRGKLAEGGSIIFMSSVMGVVGETGKTLYSMTKGAIISGVRSLALELAVKKIRVNCISPGVVITPINERLPHIANPEKRSVLENQHPLGLGTTNDIANGCIYLLSDASRWITGQNLIIDGGYTAK